MLLGSLSAKTVDEATACTVASHFFAMKYNHAPESLTPSIVFTAPSLHGENGSSPSFYVVNFNDKGGLNISTFRKQQLACALVLEV